MAEQEYTLPTGEVIDPRAECESALTTLRELARIHQSIDEPSRSIGADEPVWIYRLRKICLHVYAIQDCVVEDIDITHLMAPDLRAAYVQMGGVWNSMPPEFKLGAIDSDYWAKEARDGLLATYDHPTPFNLIIGPTALGGFNCGNSDESHLQLALWLRFLGLGYGSALVYLAEVLGVGRDVDSRLEAAIKQGH